jgi:hypothetical protein
MICYTACYTNNDRKYLNITFNESRLDGVYIKKYLDTVQNKGESIPDSILDVFFNGDKIEENERIVHFKKAPEEWYLINFDASPCWIESIYNPNLSNGGIYDKSFLNKADLKRIKRRFISDVLNEAEIYGKQRHLPDSVMYDKK